MNREIEEHRHFRVGAGDLAGHPGAFDVGFGGRDPVGFDPVFCRQTVGELLQALFDLVEREGVRLLDVQLGHEALSYHVVAFAVEMATRQTGSPFATSRWLSGKSRSGRPTRDHGGPAAAGDPAVLVGTETSDDAGVYRLSPATAIVVHRGLHHAADRRSAALSGKSRRPTRSPTSTPWAGGRCAALALCMFPKELEPEAAREILAGGQDKVAEAGAAVVGGHTVRGAGALLRAVGDGRRRSGADHRNVGAHPGDALVLTKPLGSGLIINGLRKGAHRRGRGAADAGHAGAAQPRRRATVTASCRACTPRPT